MTTQIATIQAGPDFGALVNMIAPQGDGAIGMVAATSARVYRVTYDRWLVWADGQGVDACDLNYNTVSAYLVDRLTDAGQPPTKATLQRELGALRKAAEVLAVVDYANPVRRAAYESLKLLRTRSIVASRTSERERRALSPAEADKLLRVWPAVDPKETSPVLAARNHAIITLLLMAGVRRGSLARLTWNDVDFENGTLALRHAKNDESGEVAIFGGLEALRAWQMCQPSGYQFVFVPLRKGGHFTGDKPMTTTDLWRIVTETASRAGIGHVKPHDLRRTLLNELLSTGMPTHEVQHQALHKNASTTLNNYTGKADARARRKSGKIRYG